MYSPDIKDRIYHLLGCVAKKCQSREGGLYPLPLKGQPYMYCNLSLSLLEIAE